MRDHHEGHREGDHVPCATQMGCHLKSRGVNAVERGVRETDYMRRPRLYHMARQGVDLVAGIELLAGRIGHVQFADCPGRGAPGTGQLEFSPVLAALENTGFQGWLGAEYLPGEAGTQAGLGWLASWRNAG
jgi:hydroxypyruvate isomerase